MGKDIELLSNIKKIVLEELGSLVSLENVISVCFYGFFGKMEGEREFNVLAVVENQKRKMLNYVKVADDLKISFLIAERTAFEMDVKQGSLGEFLSDIMLTSYHPVLNGEYLEFMEIEVKKRVLKNILENLVIEHPEYCHELLIKPEYFIYEIASRKVRLFPFSKQSYIEFLEEVLERNMLSDVVKNYVKVLKELEKEKIVLSFNGFFKLTNDFIEKIKSTKNFPFEKIRRTFLNNILNVFPKTTNWLGLEDLALTKYFEIPENYLFIPTPIGPVPLSERANIEEFLKKVVSNVEVSEIKTKQIGGILNSVYLLQIKLNDKCEKRIIVKRFRDWVGLKWFPITLWTLGTKSFAVLGKTRLEKEYSINHYLRKHGFNVPKILYISPKEHLLFQEYIEGKPISETIKEIVSSRKAPEKEKLDLIEKVGKEIAKIHVLNVSLGDCKPENILVTKQKKIYFVDLEQSSRGGDKAWDLAEFLYYSGHYLPAILPSTNMAIITEVFIKGYLEAGGQKKAVRAVASPRYTKVFSIFTAPHVIFTISKICRKLGEN